MPSPLVVSCTSFAFGPSALVPRPGSATGRPRHTSSLAVQPPPCGSRLSGFGVSLPFPSSRQPFASAAVSDQGFPEPGNQEIDANDLFADKGLDESRRVPISRAACLLGGAILGIAAGLNSSSRYQQAGAQLAAQQRPTVTSASFTVGGASGGSGARGRGDDFLSGYKTPRSGVSVVYPALNVIRPAEQRSPVVLVAHEHPAEGPESSRPAAAPPMAAITVPAVMATLKTVAPPQQGAVNAALVVGEGVAVGRRGGGGAEGIIFVGASDDGRAAAKQSVQNQKFKAFLGEVEADAIKQGIRKQVVKKELGRLKAPALQVIQADRNQPEKKQTLGDYVGIRVDPRLAPGREAMAEERRVLEEVQDKWGVPAEVLVAIWGIESNFGRFMGKWPTCQALATLAFDSTSAGRGDYFRSELISALRLVDEGKVKGGQDMQGSWAGAMGQCQFMPSNFDRFAVDYDEDGRADIWGSRPDVLASMANFLSHNGWKRGQPYGRAAKAPANVSMKDVGLGKERTVEEWLKKGVVLVGNGPPLPPKSMASLIAPDGASGPAFLAGPNFRTIMRYNPSTWYAVAVGSLANGIFTTSA